MKNPSMSCGIFTKLGNRLFPYLFAAAHDAHDRGWPVMRAMVLEFPNDPACRHLDRQYMLGDSILVALTIFREDGVAEYYLPKRPMDGSCQRQSDRRRKLAS